MDLFGHVHIILALHVVLVVEGVLMRYEKGNIIAHPNMDWGHGTIMENSDGKTIQVLFEKVGRKKLSLQHVKPILLDADLISDTNINRLEINHKIYVDISFIDIFIDIKSKYTDHLVIIENGCYYEILNEDAEYLSKLYGWTIYERQLGIPMTGFPDNAKNIWDDLVSLGKPYLIVSQLPTASNNKIKRKITEVYP